MAATCVQCLPEHPAPHVRVRDHAPALGHLTTPRLELGFDEGHQVAARSDDGGDRTEDLAQRDEREVGDRRVDRTVEVVDDDRPHVLPLSHVHPWVRPQAFVELAVPDVHGDDLCRAVLQEAVGETARRGAGVEHAPTGRVDAEAVEGGFELVAAASDVAIGLAHHDDGLRRGRRGGPACRWAHPAP